MQRRVSEYERQLWEAFARPLKPLKKRQAAVMAPPRATPPAREEARPRPTPRPQPALQAIEVGRRQPGLDDTSWRMLANGRVRPQRTLDLHGRTADAAFTLLHGFLFRAQAEQLRCVEIITGLGSGAEGGILKRELPHWLSRPDLRPLVLAANYPRPGNQGSVRLLLKRRRS